MAPARAQEQAPPAAQTQSQAPAQPEKPVVENSVTVTSSTEKETPEERAARIAEGNHEVQTEEQQRILKIVPDFETVRSGLGVKLTAGQKSNLAFRAAIDPFNVVGAFFFGGLSELDGSHRGYGWGPAGYFKRSGANLADVIDGTMLGGAVYPIILHQDPRYFRKGSGSVRRRIVYSLMATFVCRGDSGHAQPNVSNIAGNLTAGLISNLYYPQQDRGVGLALTNATITTLEGSAGNLGLEFSPDVAAWWKARRQRRQQLRRTP